MIETEIFKRDNFKWLEEKDFENVANKCKMPSYGITRVVGIWHEDIICFYLLTVSINGIRSFHGHNFVKNAQWFMLPFARRYIEEEKLEWSNYNSREAEIILKRLGFKHMTTVVRR